MDTARNGTREAKMWADVRVWDNKIWFLLGGSDFGNSNEVWYTENGEDWVQIAPDRNIQPISHGQGVAVSEDYLLSAGGNYAWNAYPSVTDKSAWKFRRFRGTAVESWTDRGAGALVVTAEGEARPVRDPNALGAGIPGVQFDGSSNTLLLSETDTQSEGRSVFWVGRAPWMPAPADWDAPPVYNPLWTVVGDESEEHSCSVGLGDGTLYYASASGNEWESYEVGSELQKGPGEVRVVGVTHASDGTLQGYIDGVATGDPANHGYFESNGWSRIGSSGYGTVQSTAYPGTLGAVVIVPAAIDAATVERIHQWAQGRFGAP